MKIIESTLPPTSVLRSDTVAYDYIDSFAGDLSLGKRTITSTTVGKAFFTSAPSWIEKLMRLRDKVVRLFGLKTSEIKSNREQELSNFRCEPGEQLGIFKVFERNDSEVILGENDRHLDFRVSLYLEPLDGKAPRKLTVSTAVKFHNFTGRAYFFFVKPFHRRIVRSMLKAMMKNLETEQSSIL
jgi:hypothetical protein